MRLKTLQHSTNVHLHSTQDMLHLLMGTALLPLPSKAARLIVQAGSKDAWKQPPLFSDALNHCFPEESWRIPRLLQIGLCLFRCWLHAQSGAVAGQAAAAFQGQLQKKSEPKKPKILA